MNIDLKPFFEKYETVVSHVDTAFQRVKDRYPDEVRCEPGCADCCYAMFDLTLIEALYLNYQFNRKFSGADRSRLLEKADKTDRQTYKIKKAAYEMSRDGIDDESVMKEIALKRIRCPLLDDENGCELYAYRPIACRSYGIPQAIGGKGHTCGLSGFDPGKAYPSINRDITHDQLAAISAVLVHAIGSKYSGLTELMVPVSMALITEYDDAYLGIKTEDQSEGKINEREEK